MAYDFSKPETREMFEAEVKKRMELSGMSRAQAEMLVAVLMTEPLINRKRTEEEP